MMVMHEKNAKKLKGATLYTVTLVISVMLILMLTAIALSGAAFRRASSEFRNDQTNTTARSVVTTILNSLRDQNSVPGETLARNLSEKLKNVNDTVTLNVSGDSGTNVLPGFGTVESVTFTNIGKDDESGYFINGSGENIIKVTATVCYGHDETDRTTYTQYVTNSTKSQAKSGGSGGFIAAGGAGLSSSTGGKFFGESYTGIDVNSSTDMTVFRNPTVIEGGAVYNSSAYFTTGNLRIELNNQTSKGSGIFINGSLGLLNDPKFTVSYDKSQVKSVSDLPYIYVSGAFIMQNNLSTPTDHGFNILSGRFLNTKPQVMNLSANIFCYNTDTGVNSITDESTLRSHMQEGYLAGELDENACNSLAGKGLDAEAALIKPNSGISIISSNNSSLLSWASDIATGHYNGSVYSKGSVWLHRHFNVGDVVVGGALLIDSETYDSVINGDIYADTLCITSGEGNKLNINGTIYYNRLIGSLPEKFAAKAVTPVPNDISTYFPAGMASREDVTGKNTDHPEYKIVKTREDAVNQFYDSVQQKYKISENVSHLNISVNSRIYYQNGGFKYSTPGGAENTVGNSTSFEITESCTMVGTFQNAEIQIKPSNGQELWINLFNFRLQNSKIIVDDSDGRVNFFIPMKENYCDSGTSSSAKSTYIDEVNKRLNGNTYNGEKNKFSGNNAVIFTKRYYDEFLVPNGQTYSLNDIHLKTYYSDSEEADTVNGNYVPDIYIYGADNVYEDDAHPTPDTHLAPEISFTDQCAITGNLISPYSTFEFKNSAIKMNNNNMHYIVAGAKDESNMENVKSIAWIGSVLVGTIKELQNDFAFFYVSRNPNGGNHGGENDTFKWDIISGFASY